MRISEWQKILHATAKERGWYDGELGAKTDLRITSMLCLIHSEISEALEDLRTGNMNLVLDENGKPSGFPSELADILIRTLDLAEWLQIDLETVVKLKNQYNKTRAHKHGGKKL